MNWKDDFKKLQSPHSRILYMIFYFHKNEEINEEQRTKLKEYVILEEDKIFEIINEFESTFDENKLLHNLKRLYSEEVKFCSNNQGEEEENYQKNSNESKAGSGGFKKPLSVNTSKSFLKNAMHTINRHDTNTNSNDSSNKQVKIEELNSPVGSSLLNKKKRQQQNQRRKSTTPADKIERQAKNPTKNDMYIKSFLGRAVGSLGEEEK